MPSVSTESSHKQTLANVSSDTVDDNCCRLKVRAFSLSSKMNCKSSLRPIFIIHAYITACRVFPESKSKFQNAKFSMPYIQQNFWYLSLHFFLNKYDNHCILLSGILSFKNSEPTRTTFKTFRFELLLLKKLNIAAPCFLQSPTTRSSRRRQSFAKLLLTKKMAKLAPFFTSSSLMFNVRHNLFTVSLFHNFIYVKNVE